MSISIINAIMVVKLEPYNSHSHNSCLLSTLVSLSQSVSAETLKQIRSPQFSRMNTSALVVTVSTVAGLYYLALSSQPAPAHDIGVNYDSDAHLGFWPSTMASSHISHVYLDIKQRDTD
jgi:hypothetical protein